MDVLRDVRISGLWGGDCLGNEERPEESRTYLEPKYHHHHHLNTTRLKRWSRWLHPYDCKHLPLDELNRLALDCWEDLQLSYLFPHCSQNLLASLLLSFWDPSCQFCCSILELFLSFAHVSHPWAHSLCSCFQDLWSFSLTLWIERNWSDRSWSVDRCI